MSYLRASLASATLILSLPALAACGAVQQVQSGFQQGYQTAYHKSFRSNFRSSFLRSCEHSDDSKKAFCECTESTLEKGLTDDQLEAMKPDDKRFTDALAHCRSKL